MPATPPIELPLIEIFSSIQGEGLLIGCRQLFVRLAECNLNCAYCDTPYRAGRSYRVEQKPGSGQFAAALNPANAADLTGLVRDWTEPFPGLHHALVLTGGEPLLHAETLCAWLPDVTRYLPVFLETNGTLPAALALVLPSLRWVSMDIKIASTAGFATPWAQHEQFMHVAGETLCQVKIVVDDKTTRQELLRAAELMNAAGQGVPLVLQPRTCRQRPALAADRLLALQAELLATYADVRVIPQVHAWLGVA
ncbi:MAG: 7-carboxy-7-deazaguanine synthase QueE [Desulfuromonadales bacterium]|nr:7-carboxy-7-deazaguanine synthase QueE [Desulfuromonadales bacterium]